MSIDTAALQQLRPDLPDALVAVTTRALSKARNERPEAATLANDLAVTSTSQALLSPSVVHRRRRWRRIRWIGAATVTLIGALVLAVWAGYQGALTFTGGRMPALSASTTNIPPALIAEAVRDGSLRDGEVAVYAFVPGNLRWGDAMLVTDRGIVRRSPQGARRYDVWQRNGMTLNTFRRGDARRFSVIGHPGAKPDTLHSNLSGSELGAIFSVIREITDTLPAQPPVAAPTTTASPRKQ